MSAEVASLGVDAAGARGLLTALEGDRDEARYAMVEALSSERYLDLLATLDAIEPGAVPPGEQGGTLASVWADERRRATACGEDAR